MIDCVWNEDGPPWKCQQCDWTYARQGEPILSEKPPKRNCPKAPDREQAEKERLDRELKVLVEAGAATESTRSMEDIQAMLKECRGGCVHYVNHVCLRRGSSCTYRKRWIECLIFTGCEKVA